MRRTYSPKVDTFASRLSFVAGTLVFVMVLFGIRLFVKTVVVHEATRARAEQQYLVRKEVVPRRGTIYAQDVSTGTEDKPGLKALAQDRLTYSLSVVPKNLKDPRETAQKLASWVGMSENELFDKINNHRLYLPPLAKGLSEDDEAAIATLHLPGVFFTEESDRFYPEGYLASQVLGFVNAEGHGTYGIEQTYDEDLRGTGGEVLAERDVRGRLFSATESRPVNDGSAIVLTIERNVQGFVEMTLKKAIETYQAEGGTVVIIDVKTGAIVAMANQPDFNPNEYRNVSKEEVGRFANPAIGSVWEPGSIFKTIVMASAINAGLIEPETTGDFGNEVIVDGYRINTAENKAFGHETMTQVLENSDNVAMVWIADKLGNEALHAALKKFGFGQESGIDLPGEVAGRLPSLSSWHNTTRATLAFGQGIATTPLQIASAMATLANGGKVRQPHLVAAILDQDGAVRQETESKVREESAISPTTSAKIAGMMVSVVELGHGKRAKVAGYKIAGKTGTAQISRPIEEGGGYYDDQHIGGFGGFFPADKPRFAMVVKLDRPKTVKFAESSAAPTFGEIAQYMLNYYRIAPTEPIK
ncbi:MAG: penicillin-binding protein 2 [Patescibacteria group bacterium]